MTDSVIRGALSVVGAQLINDDAWDAFAAQHPQGWYWHSSSWLRYERARRPRAKDVSLAAFDALGLRAIVPAFIEDAGFDERGRISTMTIGGYPCPEPLFDPALTPPARFRVVSDIVAQMVEFRVTRAAFRGVPFSWPTRTERWPLAEYGFRDASWRTRVLGLRERDETLMRGVRRSYKQFIRRGQRAFNFVVADSGDWRGFGGYALLHHAEAPDARPAATYELMRRMVERGDAVTVTATRGETPVAAALAIIYKGDAYYASGASVEPNAMHAVQWKMLDVLRTLGVGVYELGWQGEATTTKGKNIEFFKTGWGGVDVALPVSERTEKSNPITEGV